MSEQLTIGTYQPDVIRSECMIQLTLFPADLVKYWSRCGLTADFAASFLAFRFPDKRKAANALSVILNEIVENAVKFSNTKNGRININLFNMADKIVYEVENYIDEAQYKSFAGVAADLLSGGDLDEKYFTALSQKAEGSDNGGSGLGLLTILHDFNGLVGVRFTRHDDGIYLVSIQVAVRPEDMQG